ncbi:serine/threonine protein kinase [Pseudanabaena sp. FACHB-1277]|jgi:serine/threonine-protein kinase|uniref:non-specific serine/threonine protein kinase n=1 Tax=Pseudanabaena cinerea FACHB-1277 TaxID=2949581 RepID=A0A926Z7I6_9CYAN|nr:serine/threonine-protein kinase [Pseudanabaena cinerea]MBD2152106.1 serine/threonine protein kinase [Pseudanabaena cinerea FACHB-1277]
MQPPLSQGFVLRGRYAIDSTLGQGGMGRTYLAHDLERFNEPCVLKEFIPPQDSQEVTDKAKELFRREASVLYQIRHPQVPEFRATFETEGRLLLVQDYVDGKNYRNLLLDRLKAGQTFTETEILELMQQLLPVLSYLHSHNIIHRDISPENLMRRSQDNLPVLIDFGVVQETNAKLSSQMGIPASTVAGKAGYAPPEQLQSGNAYANSDLYALAVTSIVLLTGKEPSELFDSINLAWNWQQFTNVNPAFARVINQMLSYKPTNRYRSADEVLQALQVSQASFSSVKTYAVSRPLPTNVAETLPQKTVLAGGGDRRPVRNSPSNLPSQNRRNDGGINWVLAVVIILAAGIGSWAVTSLFFNRPRIAPTPTETAIASPTETISPVPVNTNIELNRIGTGVRRGAIKGKVVAGEIINARFSGDSGDTLTVELNGSGLQMTILTDEQPINRQATKNTSGYWQGVLKKDGIYYVQIQTSRTTPSNYELTVQLQTPERATPRPIPPSPTPTPTPTPSIPTPDPTPTPLPTDTPSPSPSPTDPARSPIPSPLPIPPEPAPEPIKPIPTTPPASPPPL